MNGINLGNIPNVYIPSSSTPNLGGESSGGSFSDVLKNAVDTVNTLHDNAASQVSNLIQGGGTDMNDVMVAVEKADVSFQLMMQVRNKIVSAYQDIEKMQF
ncbi:MAG TPA: flagellar hook-basal body complex protein FliE [Terracidiphilus sp.]|jgi:flagellar hook-basal body complex protein FliE|nr:flagellar hook-basal body complex protein FliE [Terracidiphilus sp.]